jgi:hypothetical protein
MIGPLHESGDFLAHPRHLVSKFSASERAELFSSQSIRPDKQQ